MPGTWEFDACCLYSSNWTRINFTTRWIRPQIQHNVRVEPVLCQPQRPFVVIGQAGVLNIETISGLSFWVELVINDTNSFLAPYRLWSVIKSIIYFLHVVIYVLIFSFSHITLSLLIIAVAEVFHPMFSAPVPHTRLSKEIQL